jgi:hypothetical protein
MEDDDDEHEGEEKNEQEFDVSRNILRNKI